MSRKKDWTQINTYFNLNKSIMIHLKVKELCLERGITAPVAILMKIGISQGIITKYLTGKASTSA
jgi:hypothetical protein